MLGVSSLEWRSQYQALPWITFVPPLVLTLTSDPVVWPTEASNGEVCTLNSPMDACGGENATRTFTLSENVLVTPSIVNSLLNMPLPSVENCEGALLNGALRNRMSVPFPGPGASS